MGHALRDFNVQSSLTRDRGNFLTERPQDLRPNVVAARAESYGLVLSSRAWEECLHTVVAEDWHRDVHSRRFGNILAANLTWLDSQTIVRVGCQESLPFRWPFFLSMKIIDRHITLSVLLATIFGVAVISLALVLANVLRDLMDLVINQNLPLSSVLYFVVLALPFSFTYTIPWGLLIAVLLIFGRMSADNELVALQANGVSILRVCAPVFVLAVGLSGFCLWINLDMAPRSKLKMRALINELATRNPASLFQAGNVIDQFSNLRIYVDGKEGNKLTNLFIFETDESGASTRMIFAKEGILSRDSPNGGWSLHFHNARFEESNKKDPSDVTNIRPGMVISEGTYPLPMDKLFSTTRRGRRLSDYTLPELTKFIAEGAGGEPLRARVEYAQRFSLALACMTFTLIGVPLGIQVHRKETTIGFGISLVIAFGYFFYIILARELGSNPRAYPVLIMWWPNIIFGLLGAFLLVRLFRR